jgi:hypothetical protein
MKTEQKIEDEALTGLAVAAAASFPALIIALLAMGMASEEKPKSGTFTDNPKNWKERLSHKKED